MTDREINETVVEVMRLRLFGEESRAPEQVKEILLRLVRTTYTEAIEEAAKRALETVQAIENEDWTYTTLQKAAMVAASVRRLIEEEEAEQGK